MTDCKPAGGYTSHGHPIPGASTYPPERPPVARCGGPSLCHVCAREAQAWAARCKPEKVGVISPQVATATNDAVLLPRVQPSREDAAREVFEIICKEEPLSPLALADVERWVDLLYRVIPCRTEAEVKVEALREAAEDSEIQDNRPWVHWWLNTRADQIGKGATK